MKRKAKCIVSPTTLTDIDRFSNFIDSLSVFGGSLFVGRAHPDTICWFHTRDGWKEFTSGFESLRFEVHGKVLHVGLSDSVDPGIVVVAGKYPGSVLRTFVIPSLLRPENFKTIYNRRRSNSTWDF